jgi:hypothetical protein
MTPHELKLWTIRKMGEIDRRASRAVFEDRMRAWRQRDAESRRRSEHGMRRSAEARWQIACVRRRAGERLPGLVAWQRQQRAEADLAVASGRLLDPQVPRYRAHVEQLLRTHSITAMWTAIPCTNAYARATRREIEVAPIVTATDYCAALHEIEHCLHPCTPGHVRVPVPDDPLKRTTCVPCECLAWDFAAMTALAWPWIWHQDAAASLRTYQSYGTPREQAAIDQWSSKYGWRRLTLRRWQAELTRAS